MSPKILVVGASGLLGWPVVLHLLDAGFRVRAMSRHIGRHRAPFSTPIEMVEGDALSRTDVAKAMEGCDGVHVSIHHEREDECVLHIVESAKTGGLGHVTYVSGTTVLDENRWFPMVDRKVRSEQAVRESGLAYTIFRPGWFMEILPRFVRGNHAIMFGHPVQKWHFIAVDDFARMVIAAYDRPGASGKTLYIHGPEAFTLSEAVMEYCRVLHPEITSLTHVPLWFLRLTAVLTGNAERRAGIRIVTYLEEVGEHGDASEANAILGEPETRLSDWLRARAPVHPG